MADGADSDAAAGCACGHAFRLNWLDSPHTWARGDISSLIPVTRPQIVAQLLARSQYPNAFTLGIVDVTDAVSQGARMARIRLDVKSDYVMRLARLSDPVGAVEELIWNALDADATDIRVQTALNPLGGIEKITVSDDGHGTAHEECLRWFGSLGGSWKMLQSTSRGGHMLHGKLGQGRIRVFALGNHVRWLTVGDGISGRARSMPKER